MLVTYLDLAAADYDLVRPNVFKDRLTDQIDSLPGVEAAAFVGGPPFSYSGGGSLPVAVDGFQTQPGEAPTVEYTQIGPAYLRTLGIPLVAVREFRRDDDERSESVAIVNEPMAARHWRGRDRSVPVSRSVGEQCAWSVSPSSRRTATSWSRPDRSSKYRSARRPRAGRY